MQRSCFTVKISLMFTSSNKNEISYIAHNEYINTTTSEFSEQNQIWI